MKVIWKWFGVSVLLFFVSTLHWIAPVVQQPLIASVFFLVGAIFALMLAFLAKEKPCQH